jgi:hypothetical protein
MEILPTTSSQRFALSIEERKLLPTDDDVRFYREHGWYLAKPLLSEHEVDAMAEAAERFWAGHRDRTLPVRPPRLTYWEPSHGDVFRNNDYIIYEDLTIARILSKPIIGAVAARLLDTDQIRVLNSTLWYKPPLPDEPTGVVPWHVDKHYWQNHTSNKLLTAFIPFHDCDEEMGTLTMVDGSHKWTDSAEDEGTKHFGERNPSRQQAVLEAHAEAAGAEIRLVPMQYKKGQMSFHDCRISHGSGPNRSSKPRRSIGLHLQDRDNRWREYRLSTGEYLTYNHDVLVRRTPEGNPDYSDPMFCPVLWEGRL